MPGSCCHARDSHAHTNRAGYFFSSPLPAFVFLQQYLLCAVGNADPKAVAAGEVEEQGLPCPDKGGVRRREGERLSNSCWTAHARVVVPLVWPHGYT